MDGDILAPVGRDAQLLQLPDESCVAPVVFPSEFQDQPADLLGSPTPTSLLPTTIPRPALPFFPDPPLHGRRRDDRHQVPDRRSHQFGIPDQPGSFRGRHRDPTGDLATQDRNLHFGLLEISDQLAVGPGSRGQNEEYMLEEAHHGERHVFLRNSADHRLCYDRFDE